MLGVIKKYTQTTTGRVAGNTVYQIMAKVFSMTITAAATVLITRQYGREAYGEFNLMQNWPALFFIIIDFGFNAIAVRDLSVNFDQANKYLKNILFIRIIGSALVWFCLAVFIYFVMPYSPLLKFGITLGSALLLIQSLHSTANIFFQARQRYDLSSLGYIYGYFVILLCLFVFSGLKLTIYITNFSYVLGGLTTFAIYTRFLKKLGLSLTESLDVKLIKYFLVQALPLGLMFIFSQINFKADNLIMSFVKINDRFGLNNNETVAVYGLAYKVFEVLLVVPTFLMNSVYPVLVLKLDEGRERFLNIYFKVIGFLVASSLFIGLAGYFLAPFAVKILGGDEFYLSANPLRILLAGLFLYNITQPMSWLIVILGKQKILPLIYLIGAVCNVSLNLIFIPKYSFYASSIITHISEFLILLLLLYFVTKYWKQKYA